MWPLSWTWPISSSPVAQMDTVPPLLVWR